MYDALLISSFIIGYSNKKGYGISNLKLQKILYFIQAYFLITKDEPCFSDLIEAWDFGPVVPTVYQEFKQFGGGNIPYTDNYFEENNLIHEDNKEDIKRVVDRFKDFTSTDLVTLTQSQTPWKRAYTPFADNIITNESIKEYFNR